MSIAAAPQAQRNAPSGPQNPKMRTEDSLASRLRLKVVLKMRMAAAKPPNTAPNWINKCAGVQNVSRPIVMCQEMSQYNPVVIESDASTEVQAYQGIASAPDWVAAKSVARVGVPATV